MLSSFAESQPGDQQVADTRPRFGIGHISLVARDVEALAAFYARIGMRPVMSTSQFAIVELRGGTHIVIQRGSPGGGTLDLIVDDIDDTWRELESAGAEPGPITRSHPHDRFHAVDPEHNALIVASDHSIGIV